MKNLFIILLTTLCFPLACNVQEPTEKKEDDSKLSTPEADATAVCDCINQSLSVIAQGPKVVKQYQEKCNPQLKELRKKYKGKNNADEETVDKIMDRCEVDFTLNMQQALAEQKQKAKELHPTKDDPVPTVPTQGELPQERKLKEQ